MKIGKMSLAFIIITNLILGFKFINIPYMAKYALGLIWITIALSKPTQFWNKQIRTIEKNTLKRFLFPYIILFFVSPIFIVFFPVEGIGTTERFTRLISQFIQSIVCIGYAYATFLRFKESAVNKMLSAVIINNVIGIIWALYRYGISQFISFVSNPFSSQWNIWVKGGTISTALELHEVTFTLGLFILYCIFDNHFKNRKERVKLVLIIILIILGFKRIQVAALLLMVLISVFYKKRQSFKSFSFVTNILMIGVMVVLLAYIAIISSDIISIYAIKYNINFMSRLEWYEGLTKYYSFSPLYLGKGWGTVSKIVDGLSQGTHNDILRNYIEFGFFGFVLWLYYYLKLFPTRLYSYSSRAGKMWMFLIIYMLITYMTDNTFTYFIFQVSAMIITMSLLYKEACNT